MSDQQRPPGADDRDEPLEPEKLEELVDASEREMPADVSGSRPPEASDGTEASRDDDVLSREVLEDHAPVASAGAHADDAATADETGYDQAGDRQADFDQADFDADDDADDDEADHDEADHDEHAVRVADDMPDQGDVAAMPVGPGELGAAVPLNRGDRELDVVDLRDGREGDATPTPGSRSGSSAELAELSESHAWRVAEEVVRSLPAGAAAADATDAGPVPPVPAAATPGPDGGHGTAHLPSSHVSTRPTGWHALGSALRPRATRAQLLAGVLCAVLGFAIVVQLRQNGDSTLSQLRQDDLVRLLDEASTRSDQLSREAADLQRERDQLVSGSNTRQAAIDAARRSAATQGILAGRLPAVGPGVRITVTDTGGSVRPITMLNMLEELRNAGAEAVQLNDQRITASSSFTGSTGAVQLDGTTLSAPYVWLVIGDPDTIATALDIPGGAMAYVRNDGGSGVVDKLTQVHVDALRPATTPRYATPAAVPGS